MLPGIPGNRKPFLPVRNPNVFRGENTVQLVKGTESYGQGIRPAFAFRKNLAAASGTKLARKIVAGRKFRHGSRDAHMLFEEQRPDKKRRPGQALAIPAMTRANIDRPARHHKFHGPAKALPGSNRRCGFTHSVLPDNTFRRTVKASSTPQPAPPPTAYIPAASCTIAPKSAARARAPRATK